VVWCLELSDEGEGSETTPARRENLERSRSGRLQLSKYDGSRRLSWLVGTVGRTRTRRQKRSGSHSDDDVTIRSLSVRVGVAKLRRVALTRTVGHWQPACVSNG
jgi:hypothetical protein